MAYCWVDNAIYLVYVQTIETITGEHQTKRRYRWVFYFQRGRMLSFVHQPRGGEWFQAIAAPTASLWLSGASSTHRFALTRQDPCIEEEEPACQPAGYKRKGATHLMVNQKSCSRYVPSLTRRILQPLRLSVPAASFIKPAEPLSVSSWCIYAIAYGGERCETPNTLCCCFQIDVALWGLRGKGCARVPSSQQKESSLTNWTNSTRS